MILSQGFSVTFAPLNSLQIGEQGTFYKLRGVDAADAHLHTMGLTLGMAITLVCRSPQLIIQVQGQQIPISAQLAQRICVRVAPTCPLLARPQICRRRSPIPAPQLLTWLQQLLSHRPTQKI